MHATKNRCVVVGIAPLLPHKRWLIFMYTCARPDINRSFRFVCFMYMYVQEQQVEIYEEAGRDATVM